MHPMSPGSASPRLIAPLSGTLGLTLVLATWFGPRSAPAVQTELQPQAHASPMVAGFGTPLLASPAWPAPERQQHPVRISPALAPLPDGHVQLLSAGLRIPQAFATVRDPREPTRLYRADASGTLPALPWSAGLTLAFAPYPVEPSATHEGTEEQLAPLFSAGQTPAVLPEDRWAVGSLATAVLRAPEERHGVRFEAPQVYGAVLTHSGEFWPLRCVGLEEVEGHWVVRFLEMERFLDPDPLAWLSVQVRGESHHFAQVWSLSQLQRGLVKEPQAFATGTLEVLATEGGYFGEFIEKQALDLVHLTGPVLLPEQQHTALQGWLACPDPALWSSTGPQGAKLTGVPIGTWDLHALLSGTTLVEQSARVRAGETTRVELFTQSTPIGGSAPHPAHTLRPYQHAHDAIWEATHISMVWGPQGNLFSGRVLNPPDASGEQDLGGPWSVAHPVDTDFHWNLMHVVDAEELWQEDMAQVRAGFPPSAHSPQAPLARLPYPLRRLRLAPHPSTSWQGEVHITLIGGEWNGRNLEVERETYRVRWPDDAGRILGRPSGSVLYTHWFATSEEGRGSFGPIVIHESTDQAVAEIDPSMEAGWSALLVTRQGITGPGQVVSVRTYPTEDEPEWDRRWTAAAGMIVRPLPFPALQTGPALYGVVLLQGQGVPHGVRLEWPGAYDRRVAPPLETRVLEVVVQGLLR